jgi:hypothetical protein
MSVRVRDQLLSDACHVMPGEGRASTSFLPADKVVDGRAKPGHDDSG